jgi:hypothetical protein
MASGAEGTRMITQWRALSCIQSVGVELLRGGVDIDKSTSCSASMSAATPSRPPHV